MASRNIFESVFNPSDNSTPFAAMTGTLGKMMGVPNDQQMVGTARVDALKELSDLTQQTGSPQKAILQFMGTPKGAELFATDQNAFESTIKQFITSVTPPTPGVNSVSPGSTPVITSPGRADVGKQTGFGPQAASQGQMLFQNGQNVGTNPPAPIPVAPGTALATGDTGRPTGFANPPERVQTTGTFMDRANLPPEQQSSIYEAQLQTVEGRTKVELDKLVKMGKVPADTAAKLAAGLYDWKEDKNPVTGTSSWMLLDKSTGQIVSQPVTRTEAPSLVGTPSEPAKAFDPNNPKHTMIFGSGALNIVGDYTGRFVRNVNPNSTLGIDITQRRNSMRDTQTALATEADHAGRAGYSNARMAHLLNVGPDLGLTSDVRTNLEQVDKLVSNLHDEIGIDRQTRDDTTRSIDVRKQADQRISGYERVLRTLPSPGVIQAGRQLLDSGKLAPGTVTPGGITDLLSKGAEAGRRGATDAVSGKTSNPGGNVLQQIPTMDRPTLSGVTNEQLADPAVRNAVRQRLQQLKTQPSGALPYNNEAPNPARVQEFIRRPDGSLGASGASQTRIDQAFDVLANAHKQGLLGEPNEPTSKRRPPAKRRP